MRHHHHSSSKSHHHSTQSGESRAVSHGAVSPPPSSAVCANASITPSEGDVQAVREATLCLVNRERTAHGEQPLRLNEDLNHAAQAHSESMAAAGYFEHTSPGGKSFLDRLRAAGYIYSNHLAYNVGENIAYGSLQDATPGSIVAAWMASPGHRANILNPAFRDIGIGIMPHLPRSLGAGQAGAMYTEDFGVVL